MKYLSQLKPNQLKNKTCLLRVDLNIKNEKKESLRIRAILPTIRFLKKSGAKIVLLSHRGRPELKSKILKKFSLKPFAKIISLSLKNPVHFFNNFNFGDIGNEIKNSRPGGIFLLENLRFFAEEEKNDSRFAGILARLGDIYINDAFAVSHRTNASVEAIAKFLPSYAGLALEKEINNLDAAMIKFKKPLVVILGGAKVSDKIGLINNFLKKAEYFLIGGAMANTFFAGQGLPVGDSLYEKEFDLNNLADRIDKQIFLPEDAVIAKRQILDIGPLTVKKFGEIIGGALTVIWNGPMGMSEDKKFAKGTEGIANAVRRLADKNKKAKIVIGGGETIAALLFGSKTQNPKPNIFLSTGGGAMLEYLAGKKLPGIEALKNKLND